MLRRIIRAGVLACVLGLTFGFSQEVNAQARYCWIDAKTGKPVNTFPDGTKGDPLDPNHRTRPTARWPDGTEVPGQDFVRVPCPPTDTSITPLMQTGLAGWRHDPGEGQRR